MRLVPRRPIALVWAVVMVTTGLAGCIDTTDDLRPSTAEDLRFDPCVHPWPCADGSEWPIGLTGPFDLAELLHLRLPGHDGTMLDGYVYLPDVPDGVMVPTVVWAHAYFENNYPAADTEEMWTNSAAWGSGVNIRDLVEAGYAVAAYNVRGTGSSDGCFDMFGPTEQKDMAALVEALAAEEWSNGRVGMMGLSYHGTTPWEAAILAPPSLKTIVVAGMVSDLYTFYHTPQGAAFTIGAGFQAAFDVIVSGPPVLGQPPADRQAAYASRLADRACPEVVDTFTALGVGTASDVRNPQYWNDRRLIDRFGDVQAAVLLTHGFQDQWSSGHQTQEAFAWHALPAGTPKWQLEGQWGHEFPDEEPVDTLARRDDFGPKAMAWLDFWLKGVGEPPATLGTAEYQDASGDWRTSTAWPPAEAREEVLHLDAGQLTPDSGNGDASFLAAPDVMASELAAEATPGFPGPICPTTGTLEAGPATGVLFLSEPVTERVVVAGNPFAYLTLTSDRPGGLVALTLVDLGPDFACDGAEPRDVRALAQGVADLRFHGGNFEGTDFPTGVATPVRIDIVNVAEVLEPGHRLAVLASYGDGFARAGQPYTPLITLHAESHVVVPVVEGTLGGDAPTQAYPPRPFTPTPDAQRS